MLSPALQLQATGGGQRAQLLPISQKKHEGRPGGPGLRHLRSLQTQDAQLHSSVAGHGARRQNQASPGGVGRGAHHRCHPPRPTGHPAIPLLTAVTPGGPRCHLLSRHTRWVAVPTPGQSEQGCRFEPSLSCHVGRAGQKKPKLGKSSTLAHKSRRGPSEQAELPSAVFGFFSQWYLHHCLYLASSIGIPKIICWGKNAYSSMARQ